ncbi:acyl-CoA synthetase [Phaeacidiphilus oryzae]|uniref:acyl-CoA synthetase n=1 Tax=Phaeacidiphilus oryzae TaxID=348818 RepID=UPI000567D430|nr:acyl-CoA synthetase [Phaeacidiphilus oryzae]
MYPGIHAAAHPDRPAAIMAGSGETLTYAALEDRSARLADALRSAGLRPGDTLAMLTENTLRAYEIYWAARRSGLYVTPVNNHLAASEAAYIVRDCEARALFLSPALGELPVRVLAELGADRPALCVALPAGSGPSVPGCEDYERLLAAASPVPPAEQPLGADLLYSSGTTGRPKGIRIELPDRQVHEPGDTLVELLRGFYGFTEDTVYLSPAPIYHAAPLRFAASVQALGGTVVLMERFDAEAALRAIERHRVTASQWVPTMFVRMLKLPKEVRERYDLSSHRMAVHAAAPCPVEVKQAMIDWWGPILTEYYSSTESIGMTWIDSPTWLRHRGSVGQAIKGVLRVCGEDGEELPVGETGVVYFENPGREDAGFAYLGDEAKTREATHPAHPNWATNGDIGRVDEEGFLYLTDRRSFMIISGGVNIYPQEIEDALALHPAVLDAAVIGVPDPEMGESVLAVIQPEGGAEEARKSGLEEELGRYLRERIAHYKVPRRIDFTDELPRTPTGKLVKRILKQRYAEAS